MDVLTPAQEKVLDQLQERGVFRLAVKYAYNHIVITDTEGTVLYANQASQRITGYSQQEMIGNNPRLWGAQMPAEFYEMLWHRISVDRNPFIGEIKNKRKSGEEYCARITISPIKESDGSLIGFIGVEEEITACADAND